MITERLYYSDSHLLEFDATVLAAREIGPGRAAVILDRTAFYPTGGGQPHDTGALGAARVVVCAEAEDDGVGFGASVGLAIIRHDTIAELADGATLTGATDVALIDVEADMVAPHGLYAEADRAEVERAHTALLEAVEARDGDRAHEVMRAHIADMQRRVAAQSAGS